jgi:hypothetical protein
VRGVDRGKMPRRSGQHAAHGDAEQVLPIVAQKPGAGTMPWPICSPELLCTSLPSLLHSIIEAKIHELVLRGVRRRQILVRVSLVGVQVLPSVRESEDKANSIQVKKVSFCC